MADETRPIPTVAWMAYFALGPGAELARMAEAFPEVGDGYCCMGAVNSGPAYCTCWQPVFDLPQQPLDPAAVSALQAGGEPRVRDRMCADCAYRPGSPERSGDETYFGDPEELDNLAREARRFWCHQGMRQPARWRHPSGAEVPGHGGDYKPIIDQDSSVPFKADGQPADLCAGWDARRRALAAEPVTHGA